MAPGFLAESVDKKGKIDQFSTNGSDHWYNIPNHYVRSIENTTAMSAAPPGQLRAVAPTWTWWAVESFMDEVAHKFGQDPLDLRLSLLDASGKNVGGPPNTVGGAHSLRNALIVAAGKAGYGVTPMPRPEQSPPVVDATRDQQITALNAMQQRGAALRQLSKPQSNISPMNIRNAIIDDYIRIF